MTNLDVGSAGEFVCDVFHGGAVAVLGAEENDFGVLVDEEGVSGWPVEHVAGLAVLGLPPAWLTLGLWSFRRLWPVC